jgi:hypothetical protein
VNYMWSDAKFLAQFSLARYVAFRQNPGSRL